MTQCLFIIVLCLVLALPSGAFPASPTAGAVPAPPESSAPIRLTAMAVSDSQIALTWNASAGAARYRIYRDGASLGTTRMISEFDGGLRPDTRYCYRVSALDGKTDREFSLSNEACATTSASVSPAAGSPAPAQAAVIAAAPAPYALEDIHFDFDKFKLYSFERLRSMDPRREEVAWSKDRWAVFTTTEIIEGKR